MALVSLAALQDKADYKAALDKLLRPYEEMFFPAPTTLFIYLGSLYPAAPKLGVNPHPVLVAALIEWAYKAWTAKICLAARAAPGFEFAKTWQLSGYKALNSYGAKTLDLGQATYVSRSSSLALFCSEYLLPQQLLSADCLINMGKFRAGQGRLFGSAFNNLAALTDLPYTIEAFPRALVDLYSIVNPDLHIIDALRGLSGWQPQPQDALLAATDAAALDMTLATLASLPGERVEEIALAAQYGLGAAAAAEIILVGDAPAVWGLEDRG